MLVSLVLAASLLLLLLGPLVMLLLLQIWQAPCVVSKALQRRQETKAGEYKGR
jgi:hypothetical protein